MGIIVVTRAEAVNLRGRIYNMSTGNPVNRQILLAIWFRGIKYFHPTSHVFSMILRYIMGLDYMAWVMYKRHFKFWCKPNYPPKKCDGRMAGEAVESAGYLHFSKCQSSLSLEALRSTLFSCILFCRYFLNWHHLCGLFY